MKKRKEQKKGAVEFISCLCSENFAGSALLGVCTCCPCPCSVHLGAAPNSLQLAVLKKLGLDIDLALPLNANLCLLCRWLP